MIFYFSDNFLIFENLKIYLQDFFYFLMIYFSDNFLIFKNLKIFITVYSKYGFPIKVIFP